MSYFEEADEELLELAREVIRKSHSRLLKARFGFAFRSDAPVRKGTSVLASGSLVSRQIQVHLDLDYLVWVAGPEWDTMSLEHKTALLDHEFCHCYRKDNMDWGLRDHDIQEFLAVIERHGLWRHDLQRLAEVIQGYLPGLEVMEPEGAIVAAPAAMFHEGS